jgi:hypothetical protein
MPTCYIRATIPRWGPDRPSGTMPRNPFAEREAGFEGTLVERVVASDCVRSAPGLADSKPSHGLPERDWVTAAATRKQSRPILST